MKESGPKVEAVWSNFSQRWFTVMHSFSPFIFRDYQELADHAAASFECVRDIVVASHMIGHLGDDTLDEKNRMLNSSTAYTRGPLRDFLFPILVMVPVIFLFFFSSMSSTAQLRFKF
ncbi:hypothetical protein V6Z12_D12G091200 [Gossypium hirsutum]